MGQKLQASLPRTPSSEILGVVLITQVKLCNFRRLGDVIKRKEKAPEVRCTRATRFKTAR